MERIIYIPFLIIILLGLIIMGFAKSPEKYASISYEMNNGEAVANLTSGNEYMLRIKVEEGKSLDSEQLSKGYFWDVKDPRGESFHAYQLAPLFTFVETGRYVVDTYQPNGRLIATDTLMVSEGEYIDFELVEESIAEGDDAVAMNKSTYKNVEHEWVVLTEKGNELFLDDSDTLKFASPDPGYYTIMLRLFYEGDTIASEKSLTVNKKQVVRVEKPRSAPKPRATQAVVPKATIPKPKPTEKSTDGWYKSTSSSGQFDLGPAVPSKNNQNFSGGTVVIELTPKTDLQLSEFSFWGNYNTGNYSIVYECTTCNDENQKRLNPFVFRTGNDYYDPQVRRLDSKRIGFKAGHTYKLTFVTQENTQMQFEKLSKTKYENSNLTLEFITDRSSIFGLTFKTR
ncbi:hypothetical protein G3O08_08610 [Cryomorpha ignava]|uniref:Uncharacterized protein n=1 Tax=Cryomorpha ignava TaxID=101383 RepID=A0A7K3WR92_9FLAO|nr:hypothetical protein [Cryomorpha ignava]NEN23561.1 hypothetical protein [Cryomorpha ignava]